MSWPEALDTLRDDHGETFDPWLVDLFDEEIRREPMPTGSGNTVMISASGVVPYKVTQRHDYAERLLEETALTYGDELDGELEVYDDDVVEGES